ncbi:MAG: hypoxanthine phosphoribosyltransferase [Deltaproteobacteria bacterium]|nr:hypoxanthine phosphoribosyltransferase [Deltaproteobacteria bacterium]
MSIFRSEKLTVMLSEKELQERNKVLGAEIAGHYADKEEELVLVGILKGSFVFMADLCRTIDLPLTTDFIGLSSYGDSTKSSGVVQLTQDLSKSIEGKHVLIVEDIVDTGLTMRYLLENFETRNPASLKVCALLEKPENNVAKIRVDFLGFTIPDQFVIGYGLDFAEKYRNLPFVGVWEGES